MGRERRRRWWAGLGVGVVVEVKREKGKRGRW